jgi:hypothetical protein
MAFKHSTYVSGSSAAEPSSAPQLPKALVTQLASHTKEGGSLSERKTSKKAEEPKKETKAVDTDAVIEDAKTDEVVDEILKEESDAILEDAEPEQIEPEAPKKRGFWHRKWLRNTVLLLFVTGIAVTFGIPTSRYYILNKTGVRSRMSVRIMDQGTQLPLKNVHVHLDSQEAITDSKGIAQISDIKLGPHKLRIERVAFSSVKQDVTIGWGSNPLGDFTLDPTGVKYIIKPVDYVTGKPITTAQAASGDAAANADSKGVITLTIANADSATMTVDISADGYKTEQITINTASTEPTPVTLVPSAKSVYVNKQAGVYNVMTSYIDGTGAAVLLKGTGSETSNMSLAVDGAGKRAAFVSTRDDKRNADGDLLNALALIDTNDGTTIIVDHAEHIQLVDWIGTTIIFQETTSASGSGKYHIVGYDYSTNKRYELGNAAQFNSVASMKGMIYYAVSSSDPSADAVLYKVRSDGSGRQTVLDSEVWSIFHATYDTLYLQAPDGWYGVTDSSSASKISAPSNYPNYSYIESGKGKSAWADSSTGQSVLYVHDESTGKDTKLTTQSGLSYPVRWLSETLLEYRVATNGVASNYVISTNGGVAKKIADVVSTYAYNN